MTFHLYGTSLAGIPVDEYAVTDADGIAIFKDVLISGQSPYTVEEVNTPISLSTNGGGEKPKGQSIAGKGYPVSR